MSKFDERLPNTLIIGAAKAGTTSLYDLLKQHPQVFLSYDKEPRFFSHEDYFNRGIKWYTKTFFNGSESYPIRAEATPHYFYWADKVSPRLKQVFGTKPLKLIIILRNPIERAYSWYWNMVIDQRETLPFLDALKAEEKKINKHWSTLEHIGSMQYGYYRGGCYASQITRFYEDFPEDNFHIILFEDFLQDQEITIDKLTRFLGIDSDIRIKPKSSNPSSKPRYRSLHRMVQNEFRLKDLIKPFIPPRVRYAAKSLILKNNMEDYTYPEMESQAHSYLQEKFSNEIFNLSRIIKRDLSKWIN